MLEQKKFWEIIYEKKTISDLKTKIRDAMQNYKESDESLASQCKFRIIMNFSSLMQDFNDVIE